MEHTHSCSKVPWSRHTFRCQWLMRLAMDKALRSGRHCIDEEDLIWGFMATDRGVGRAALEELGFPSWNKGKDGGIGTDAGPPRVDDIVFCSSTERIIAEVRHSSQAMGHLYIGSEHMIIALLQCGTSPPVADLRRDGATAALVFDKVRRLLQHE